PSLDAELVRQRAQAGAALLLDVRRDGIVGGGYGAGPGRVREDMDLGQTSALDGAERLFERRIVLAGEADDHVARQVELARERRKASQVRVRGVAAAHRTQYTVVAGLQRHVQVL